MTESWSPNENLASLSLGVIISKFWKSKIFPHLEATWLSATLIIFFGIDFINFGMELLLKIPCLKSLKTMASPLKSVKSLDNLLSVFSLIALLSI